MARRLKGHVYVRRSEPPPSTRGDSLTAAFGIVPAVETATPEKKELRAGDILTELPEGAFHPPCDDRRCEECAIRENAELRRDAPPHPPHYPYGYSPYGIPLSSYHSLPPPPTAAVATGTAITIKTPIAGVVDLIGTESENKAQISLNLRRKNQTVIMQWEPFSCRVNSNGLAYLSINQSIPNLPSTSIMKPIIVEYKGIRTVTYIEVNPAQADGQRIRFALQLSGSGVGVTVGDHVTVFGGTVEWIMA